MQIYLIFGIVFSLLVAVFAIQNSFVVTVSFFTLRKDISLVLLVFGSIFLGAFFVGILGFFNQLKLKRKVSQFEQEIKKLTSEERLKPPKGEAQKLEEPF